jgi:hypothetical protein
MQDALDLAARTVIDRLGGGVGDRELAMQVLRRDHLLDIADAEVVGGGGWSMTPTDR